MEHLENDTGNISYKSPNDNTVGFS